MPRTPLKDLRPGLFENECETDSDDNDNDNDFNESTDQKLFSFTRKKIMSELLTSDNEAAGR